MVLDCLGFLIRSNLWMLESADQESDCGKPLCTNVHHYLGNTVLRRGAAKKASPKWNQNQRILATIKTLKVVVKTKNRYSDELLR